MPLAVACLLLSRRYLVKFVLSQILCLISFFFWRLPNDNDIVEIMEGSGMCIVLRRDHEAEAAEKARMKKKKQFRGIQYRQRCVRVLAPYGEGSLQQRTNIPRCSRLRN